MFPGYEFFYINGPMTCYHFSCFSNFIQYKDRWFQREVSINSVPVQFHHSGCAVISKYQHWRQGTTSTKYLSASLHFDCFVQKCQHLVQCCAMSNALIGVWQGLAGRGCSMVQLLLAQTIKKKSPILPWWLSQLKEKKRYHWCCTWKYRYWFKMQCQLLPGGWAILYWKV